MASSGGARANQGAAKATGNTGAPSGLPAAWDGRPNAQMLNSRQSTSETSRPSVQESLDWQKQAAQNYEQNKLTQVPSGGTSGSGSKGGTSGGGLIGQIGNAYSRPLDFSGAQGVGISGPSQQVNAQMGQLPSQGNPNVAGSQGVNFMGGNQGVNFSGMGGNVGTLNTGGLPGVRGTDYSSLMGMGNPNVAGGQGVRTGPSGSVTGRGQLAGRLGGMYGDLTGAVGGLDQQYGLSGAGSFGDERASLEKAMFDRSMNLMRPEFDRQENKMQSSLVNRGLAPTSDAYTDQYRQFEDRRGRTINDASLAAVQAGAQEHSRLADMNRANRAQVAGEQFGLHDAGLANTAQQEQLNLGQEGEHHRTSQREMALRQQQALENQNSFGNTVAGRQLGLQEGAQRYGEDMGQFQNALQAQGQAYNQQLGNQQQRLAEGQARANQQLGLRGLQGSEAGNIMNAQLGLRGLQGQEAQNQFQNQFSNRQQIAGEQGQQFGQQMGLRQLQGAEGQQRYGQQMGLRQQQIAEQMMQRTQPTNDLLSLLSGVAPGGLPQMPQLPQYAIQAPDMLGLTGSNYAAQQGAGAARSAGQNNMMGGIIGGGLSLAGSLFGSDRRFKTDIKEIGKADNGLPIYSFRYKPFGPVQLGFMADEVEQVHPEAVATNDAGYKFVDYEKAVEPS